MAAIGLDAGRNPVSDIQGGSSLFIRLGALEAQLADIVHAFLVLRGQGGDIQFHQFDFVIQIGGSAGVMRFHGLAALAGKGGDLGALVQNLLVGAGIGADDGFRGGVGDMVGRALGLVLKVHQRADDDGDHHGDQHGKLGQGGDFLQSQHQRQREHRHGQRWQVGLRQVAEHLPDVIQEGIAASLRNAQQHVELRQEDDHRRRIHEAEDDRMRDKIHDGAEFHRAERELDDAHHQRQQQGESDELFRERHRQRRDGGGGHQRDDGHRTGRELAGRPPERAENGGNEGHIKPEIHRQAGQLGIRHGFRHQHQRTRDAGNHVAPQEDRIDWKPGKKREKPEE
jgi:hypothetical protein